MSGVCECVVIEDNVGEEEHWGFTEQRQLSMWTATVDSQWKGFERWNYFGGEQGHRGGVSCCHA